MRRFIERISRTVILKRKLPKRYHAMPIYVSPDARLKLWSTNSEKWDVKLFNICDEVVKSDSIVWDVGANVGLFTFPAAIRAKYGKVLAIEPDIFLVNLLQKTISMKQNQNREWAKIDLLSLAISDQIDALEFNISERNRCTNFISGIKTMPGCADIRESRTVMGVTLDWLLNYYPVPTVLKIDVERAELQVLKGASTLLEEVRPTIIIECEGQPEYIKAVGDILKNHRYKIYNAESDPSQREELAQPVFNTIALPQ